MKTYLIDCNDREIEREVKGFALTQALVSRTISRVNGDKTSQVLVIQVDTLGQDKLLKEFLSTMLVSPMIVGNRNEVSRDGKKIGVFKQLNGQRNEYFLDSSTGKKFLVE